MKTFILSLTVLVLAAMPALAQDDQRANNIVLQMQHNLNLSEDQVASITQVIQRYIMATDDLDKSIQNGTINPSVVDSQRKQLKDVEEQGIAQYLRSDQLYKMRQIEIQTAQQQGQNASGQDQDAGGDPGTNADQYSNLPNNPSQTQ
jgi:hypothetical protein